MSLSSAASSTPEEPGFDWARIGRTFVAHWWLLLAAPLVAGLVAYAATRAMPREYEAATLLMVTARIGQQPEAVGRFLAPLQIMLRNRQIARDTLQSLNLEESGMTPDALLDRMTVEPLVEAGAIRLVFQLPDPELAAAVANRFSAHAVKFAETLTQREAGSAEEALRLELERAASRLRLAETNLLTYQREAQITLGQKDLDSMMEERGRLIALQARIASERAQLDRAERELADAPQHRQAPRVADIPAGEGSPIQARGEAAGAYMNPVYESLQWQVSHGRSILAGLEQEYAMLTKSLGVNRLPRGLFADLYAKQSTLARLETDHEIAKRIYSDLAVRHEQARLTVVSQSADLQLLDEAVPPAAPVSPRVRLIVVMSATAAAAAAALLILIFDRWRNGPNVGPPREISPDSAVHIQK